MLLLLSEVKGARTHQSCNNPIPEVVGAELSCILPRLVPVDVLDVVVVVAVEISVGCVVVAAAETGEGRRRRCYNNTTAVHRLLPPPPSSSPIPISSWPPPPLPQ